MATKDKTVRLPVLGSLGGWAARAFGILLFFVGWVALASVFPEDLLPFPQETLLLAWEFTASGSVWPHLAATLSRIFWGFLGGMAVGVFMGVQMGISDYQRKFLTPHVMLSLSIPHISWGITATLIFGYDILAPIVATILVVFPFVAVNVWKGVENIDGDLLKMSQSFDLSFSRTVRRIILPNIAPSLFSGSRLGLAMSWKAVTITEMFAASSGLGYKIIESYESIYFERAWAWVVIAMVVILLIEYGIFKPLQRRVFEYRQDADFTMLG
ncbi:ABC transporter permease [Salinibaculum salinum]|uniref:ABC transporter permease n=1 Tax=Salinibaculum salinum TaxID=3131996 RepID=UPI0030EF0104